MTKPIMLLLTLFFSLNSHAVVTPNTAPHLKFDPFKIKSKDIENITGKKLTVFQKLN
jgi:hypothetical protein